MVHSGFWGGFCSRAEKQDSSRICWNRIRLAGVPKSVQTHFQVKRMCKLHYHRFDKKSTSGAFVDFVSRLDLSLVRGRPAHAAARKSCRINATGCLRVQLMESISMHVGIHTPLPPHLILGQTRADEKKQPTKNVNLYNNQYNQL